jgi:PAS domain S-box-containing protein
MQSVKDTGSEILIAEDSRTQAEQLRFLLEEQGYQVTTTANGKEALDAAQARKPALLVSDIVMPELDGYGLCRAIKSDEKLRDIPIILVTSLADPHDVIRGLECGADNFIRKPYDGDYLLSRINYLLMNHELRKSQKMQLGVEIDLGGHKHFITAERQQILDLLISTYEQAVHVNQELTQRDQDLLECNQRLTGLYRIADGLNHADSESAVAETVLERALELPGIQAGCIWLRDGESGFRLAATRNLSALDGQGACDGDCVCQRKLLSGELDNAVNIIECERLAQAMGEAREPYHHASIPLWNTGRSALGVMNLVGSGDGLFDETVLKMLFGIGNQVAVALERARLHERLERLVEERTAKLAAEVAQRRLVQEEQARLAAIVEATPDLVATAGLDGRVLYYNPAGRRMLGFELEFIPFTVNLFDTHPAWAARIVREEAIPYALEHGTWSGETALLGPDGGEIPVLQVIIAHKGRDGTAAYLSTIARDITTRKSREAAMLQLNETLENKVAARTADLELARRVAEDANRAKSAFLATMSHEIRTPMNGVIGMVDVLHQTSLKGYQVEMVDLIRDSAYALLGIIDDILDFSKIEAGKLEIERVPMSPAEVVEKACDMLDRLAEKKGVELTLFTDPALPAQVLGDPGRLRQILVNLANNAIKFSSGREQPGKVSIRALLAESGSERVVVELRVADNGIGMDKDLQARLFTPFAQADASTTRRYGGTGLGLAIVHHMVALKGGEVAVQSEPGQGSTFSVRLPFTLSPDQADAVDEGAPVAGLSCLLVGGPEGLAGDFVAYLQASGALAERVPDLAAALRWAGTCQPGLWVWVIDFGSEHGRPDDLRAARDARPDVDCRLVVIERGKRRRIRRLKEPERVMVDGNVLNRRTFLRAVAIATGRLWEESEAQTSGSEEAAFQPPSHEQALRQGRLILIAEDNETNQKVILQQLALLGYAADVAGNGRVALERWQAGDYALLLSDLHMPEMDGYELAAAIRAAERGSRRMPIVALTANALRGEAEHCRAVGMDDYLSKPARLADLKAMLEKWLPSATEAGPDYSGVSTPVAEPVPVDVSVLEGLVGDDPAVIREFLQDFRLSTAKIAVELKAACHSGQAAQAGAAAHKLKSSARSVGALALGELCAEMEQAGKAGKMETLAGLLPRFEAEMAAVDQYLSSL